MRWIPASICSAAEPSGAVRPQSEKRWLRSAVVSRRPRASAARTSLDGHGPLPRSSQPDVLGSERFAPGSKERAERILRAHGAHGQFLSKFIGAGSARYR
jgi:hypothetical protein